MGQQVLLYLGLYFYSKEYLHRYIIRFISNPYHLPILYWSYYILLKLLIQCAQYMPGQFQCDNYLRPVFTLTSFELVQRTFAILSCILLGIALIMMLIGMETSKIFLREENVHIKMKLMKGPALRLLRSEET